MGFFDKLKKNSKQNIENNREEQLSFDIEYSSTSNGNLQVEYFDKDINFKKFYDVTRLVIKREPLNIENHQVYNCAVSWYGSGDCKFLNEKTGKFENISAQDYRGVLLELDLELLENDINYCNMVMKKLLDKERVEKYLENGLEETPKQPCGKYVGGVKKTENGYTKFFSTTVGQASHNSELMVNRRKEHREMLERKKQKDIESKRAQIEKLQREIDNMERC